MAYDKDAARELELFIDNDGQLYAQQTKPIIKNLATKKAQGKYTAAGARKLFMYLMNEGAKRYARRHSSSVSDWNLIFSVATRKEVAGRFVRQFEDNWRGGYFRDLVPKKYR